MKASNRVIVNTGILYGDMLINAVFAFISTRWVLEALGVEDYGIYNLVGGIIAMFSFLNVAMMAATQRFISFSLGQEDYTIIRDTFKCSVILHVIIGLIVFCIFEFIGHYFLYHKLQIPHARIDEAVIVLHCLSISTFFTIITVPYQAYLNAMENMLIIAILSTYQSFMKLCIAIVLLGYVGDRLVLYSVLMMSLAISALFLNRLYCWRKYKDVRIIWNSKINKGLFKKMFSFAGWNFIGSISSILRNQGLSMLMNTFFGVIVNAAYGIATQVNGQAQFFSRSIVRALQPQIVKSEGAGDRLRMQRLALTTCKVPFIILSAVVCPLIAEMPTLLKIWLKTVPDNSVIFCRLILIVSLLMQIKIGLSIAIDSVGKIKWYQIVCGGLHFVVLPIAYLLYLKGFSAYYGMLVVIFDELATILFTSFFAWKIASISYVSYYCKVFFPCITLVLCVSLLTSYVTATISNELFRVLSYMILYCSAIGFVSYKLILNKYERNSIKIFCLALMYKLFRK